MIVNLILNAVHAMRGGGSLEVVTSGSAETITISVEDNGAGIPENVLPRIFDPFYTTKQAQGTGLGLSISQQLVIRAGGRITVDSRLGEGSKFMVYLPIA